MRLLIAVLFLGILSGGAAAQSCSALRSQLAAAQSGGPDRAAISRLERQARAYGCNSSRGFGRHASCGRIEAQLRSARQGTNSRAVSQLRRRVSRVCAQEQRTRQPQRVQRTRRGPGDRVTVVNVEPRENVFSALFGGGRRTEEVERLDLNRQSRIPKKEVEATRSSPQPARSSSGVYRIGNARTVCVRLCDGFYFPINSQSHWRNFKDELAMCVGRCPGADVSLYAHNRDAPVESMRSAITGERYVSLPTAFRYRRERVSNCTCQPQTIAATQSADEALAYVEAKAEDAADAEQAAAEVAAEEPQAKRLKAVFDETGEPLYDTLRKLQEKRRADGVPAAPTKTAGAEPPVSAPADEVAERQPVQSASVSLRVREVGPRFFTGAEERDPERRVLRPSVSSAAVSVVPVAASAIMTDREDAPQRPEALVDGAPPTGEPGGAQTSALPGTPSGG